MFAISTLILAILNFTVISGTTATTKKFINGDSINWVAELKIEKGSGVLCSRVEAHILSAEKKEWNLHSPFARYKHDDGFHSSSRMGYAGVNDDDVRLSDGDKATIVAYSSGDHPIFGSFPVQVEVGRTYKFSMSDTEILVEHLKRMGSDDLRQHSWRLHLICVEPFMAKRGQAILKDQEMWMPLKRKHLATSEAFELDPDSFESGTDILKCFGDAQVFDVSPIEMFDLKSKENACTLTGETKTGIMRTRMVVDKCGRRYDKRELFKYISYNQKQKAQCGWADRELNEDDMAKLFVDERFLAQQTKFDTAEFQRKLKNSGLLDYYQLMRCDSNLQTDFVTPFDIPHGLEATFLHEGRNMLKTYSQLEQKSDLRASSLVSARKRYLERPLSPNSPMINPDIRQNLRFDRLRNPFTLAGFFLVFLLWILNRYVWVATSMFKLLVSSVIIMDSWSICNVARILGRAVDRSIVGPYVNPVASFSVHKNEKVPREEELKLLNHMLFLITMFDKLTYSLPQHLSAGPRSRHSFTTIVEEVTDDGTGGDIQISPVSRSHSRLVAPPKNALPAPEFPQQVHPVSLKPSNEPLDTASRSSLARIPSTRRRPANRRQDSTNGQSSKSTEAFVSTEPPPPIVPEERRSHDLLEMCGSPKTTVTEFDAIADDQIPFALINQCFVKSVMAENKPMAYHFLKLGADVQTKWEQTLGFAIEKSDIELVRMLVRANMVYTSDFILKAINESGNYDIVKMLLLYSHNKSRKVEFLEAAINLKRKDLVELLLDNGVRGKHLMKEYKQKKWRDVMGSRYWQYKVKNFFRRLFRRKPKRALDESDRKIDHYPANAGLF